MTRRVVLVGNPNVGKSTVFNALTGMRQHTGNWAGVTVSGAIGTFEMNGTAFSVVDLPGIYSFDTRSEEEAVTKRFVESGEYDVLVLICDATCLERGLHLLRQLISILQLLVPFASADHVFSQADVTQITSAETDFAPDSDTRHCTPQLILCVNLCDEAAKKGIIIDFPALEQELRIPVVPCCARDRDGLDRLKTVLSTIKSGSDGGYPLLFGNSSALSVEHSHKNEASILDSFSPELLAAQTVHCTNINYRKKEETLDRIFTGQISGTLCMLLLLTGVFWITITGANYPSSLLWDFFFRLEAVLWDTAAAIGLPQRLTDATIFGVYRVVAWIISVMLPPMAIFFPLFTLLEDFGLLPRIAYNMDGAFHSCGACGKQCLTMAMGLGCNAAGVTGCRIIDSPRERLIAILTNSLVPCNGRFPLLITMISLCSLSFSTAGASALSEFPSDLHLISIVTESSELQSGSASRIVHLATHFFASLFPALALTIFLLLGVAATLAVSLLLSRTILKGMPSSFTLELPPYRRPQIGKVIVRSIFDRTLFVLARAVAVAAPAGLLIWIMANLQAGNGTLLELFSGLLEPLGRLMGLDGVILMAFLLGFPANEIVLPIILMAYMQTGRLVEMEDTATLLSLLTTNGWTVRTFVCMAVFSLFHWPCSTTCLTIRKETGSWRWTTLAILIPTLIGMALCFLTSVILQCLA